MANPTAELSVKIEADTKNLKAGLTKANSQVGGFAQNIKKHSKAIGLAMIAMGAIILAVAAKAVLSYAKMGDEVHKMALRTGFATEALSELRHVAQLSGTDLGSIEKATKKMSKTLVDAADGMATYIRAFDRIGLSAEALLQLAPEEQFWTIAKAIGDLEDQTLKAATAVDIFGRAGTMLLPMLEMTSEELSKAQQEAHDLGVVFDEEAAVKAAELTDAMGKLKLSLQGIGIAIAEELVPIVTDFLENKVIPMIQKIKDWIAENEGLIKTLVMVGGVLVAGGALLLGLGMISKAIVAINTALVIMHGLMGPAGWAKLAVGIAIAAGAIIGIKALMGDTTELPSIPTVDPNVEWAREWLKERKKLERPLPQYQHGGIVPGPIGEPVPVMAHGGEEFAGVGSSMGQPINIHIGSFMGDESSLNTFARKIKEIMGRETRRTSFSGINRLEYFPGSSSV